MSASKITIALCVVLCAASSAAPLAQTQRGTLASEPPPPQTTVAPWPSALLPIFQSAAADYNVPLELLLTIGYYGSGFENRGDDSTVEGGYGLMALRKNTLGGDSLTLGAQLLNTSETTLKLDAQANILAAAAVLDEYARQAKISREKGVEAWLAPVIRYGGLDEEGSRFWAMEIFRQIKSGLDITNSEGERFAFAPVDIGAIDLSALVPPAIQPLATVDYPLAIWDAAASCNYSTASHNSDTVVIHTAEGTAAGTLSWFKNCNHGNLGPSSSHYVVDSAGTVWQMVRESQTAWHAGCYNGRSVGIEHEGYASASSHPKALYDGSAALTRNICDRWGIPKEKRAVGPGIIGHVDVTNCCCGSHTDPGNGWDWNYYIQQVAGGVQTEQVYVESRSPGLNSQWYSDDSGWGNSAGWCGGFDTNLKAGGSRYLGNGGARWCQVQPVLGAAGGTYKVEVAHYGTTNISSDIVVSYSLTGCTGLSGTTTAFQSGQSCMWVNIGQITLNPGVTQPTIRFNLAGGTVDGTHRWNTEAFRFTLIKAPLSVAACPGGVVVGGGVFNVGDEATVTAAAFANSCFVNWTSDGCGGTAIASRRKSYTFNMPPASLTLTANFTRGLFYEGFEGLATGSLDMNDASGPNKDTKGDKNGNPWFGPAPANGAVVKSGGVSAHSGSNMLTATSGVANCIDMINAAYRLNSGNPFGAGLFLDWWFYDPKGSAADASLYQDFVALCSYDTSTLPTNSDYGTLSPFPGALQRLSLGASSDTASGYDKTRYQARIPGAVDGYDQGWFNTAVGRTVGWHRARIVIGPAKSPSNTSDISFFIDNMITPALIRDSVVPISLNSLQINTRPNSSSNVSGYYDDITFGRLSGTPLAASPAVNTQSSVTWNWSSGYPPSDGFHLWETVSSIKASPGPSDLSWTETGLTANTAYTRLISSYFQIASGQVDSPRIQLGPVYTLAAAPVYASSGAGAVTCDKGPGSASPVYAPQTPVTFTAVNGFGAGALRASGYDYVWDTSAGEPAWGAASLWTSGTLNMTASSSGSYYLHLRALNGSGVATPVTLTLGPYVFEATAVGRIGDLWQINDSTPLTLEPKTVTAVQPDVFWLEEVDRSAALKVLWSGGGVTAGRLMRVTGMLGVSGAVRALSASAVQDTGPASPIAPLWMTGVTLGGESANSLTPGVSGGLGLYNIGLLVRMAGSVTYASSADPANQFFYLDDGSGLADGSGHVGVKVKCGSIAPPVAGFVAVQGVVDAELTGPVSNRILVVSDALGITPL
ncbi:MAG: N-acetylmuramoyl-L-alanine amidase [Armatimonadetes bacterium]|nr:N-acetylmuramoyl-L-alanine amidase [Armatimonadota bacterium]